ncbi:MAG: hypothetical protein Q9216_004807 [Gyalolechia sp. 2 TL-2023]
MSSVHEAAGTPQGSSTQDRTHPEHHPTSNPLTHEYSKTSPSNNQNPTAPKDQLSSPVHHPSAPLTDPQGWVDPLLLSPLTRSSQASSPSWVDPLQDWDGTLPEDVNRWVDPLIDNPLSSHSKSPSSSSQQPSSDLEADSPRGDTTIRKRKRTTSNHSTDNLYPETASSATSNMPEEAHKGKNVPQPKVPKIPKDETWVKGRLEAHGLIQNDRDAYKRYPDFAAEVEKIINRKRKSEVGIGEFEDFQFTLEKYQGQNEDSVLVALLPFIIKSDRTVQVSEPGNTTEDTEWEIKSFLRSGLVTIVNREFARTFQSFRDDGSVLDKELIKALQKEDGMTNPKPDRTFAIMRDKYKFPQHFRIPAHIDVYLEVMNDVHLPFCILEGKSHRGSALDAANAACRGGATLVRTARLLRADLGEADVVGADHRTFVFSVTMSPGLIEVWVHWAEVPGREEDRETDFHMTKLCSRALDDEQQFGQVRRMLHNILDWGCGARFDGLKPLYEAIQSYEQRQRGDSMTEGVEQTSGASSKKQKKG